MDDKCFQIPILNVKSQLWLQGNSNKAIPPGIFGDTLHVSLMYLSLLHDLFMPLFIEHCPELSNSSILALY